MRKFARKSWAFAVVVLLTWTVSRAGERVFSLAIGAEQDTVKSDSDLMIDAVETNISNRPIAWLLMSGEIEVFDAGGNRVKAVLPRVVYHLNENGGPGWTEGPVELPLGSGRPFPELKPGESRKRQWVVNKLYDLTEPGKYTIHVSIYDSQHGDGTFNGSFVNSNTISVTVVP